MAKEYFEQLNYTLANEDASLEMNLLPHGCEHVAAVCGSGARIIPLLAKQPSRITVIDISKMQLELCEVRIESLREFSHSEYLSFWGYRSISIEERKMLFERLHLRTALQRDFERLFDKHRWNPILLQGRWEKTFVFFSKIAQKILGEKRIDGLFECKTLEEQTAYVEKEFFGLRWKLLLLLVGNSRTFNALLYRGSFPVNNTGKSYLTYYHEAFVKLFRQGLARENFFLQLALLGELKYSEGFPVEVDPAVFAESKKGLAVCKIDFIQHDLVNWLAFHQGVDFVSFSNVASYFTGNREKEFLSEIRDSINPGGIVVMRHYLHHPSGLDRTGFEDRTENFQELISKEKVQMYDVEILERSGA